MALDYGYTIRIQSNGTSNPSATPTNQWQRKLSGQSDFTDISGETGTTYKVESSDQSSQIRLKQNFNGSSAYSNALSVTSSAPGVTGGEWIKQPFTWREGTWSTNITIKDYPGWAEVCMYKEQSFWATNDGITTYNIGNANSSGLWGSTQTFQGTHLYDPSTKRIFLVGYSSSAPSKIFRSDPDSLRSWERMPNPDYDAGGAKLHNVGSAALPWDKFCSFYQNGIVLSSDKANASLPYSEGTAAGKGPNVSYYNESHFVNGTLIFVGGRRAYSTTDQTLKNWHETDISVVAGGGVDTGLQFKTNPPSGNRNSTSKDGVAYFCMNHYYTDAGSNHEVAGLAGAAIISTSDGINWQRYQIRVTGKPNTFAWRLKDLMWVEELGVWVCRFQEGINGRKPPSYNTYNTEEEPGIYYSEDLTNWKRIGGRTYSDCRLNSPRLMWFPETRTFALTLFDIGSSRRYWNVYHMKVD